MLFVHSDHTKVTQYIENGAAAATSSATSTSREGGTAAPSSSSSSVAAMSVLSVEAVGDMKVAELKEELTSRGLDSSGKKAVLAARLVAWLGENEGTAGPGGPGGVGEGFTADEVEEMKVVELKDALETRFGVVWCGVGWVGNVDRVISKRYCNMVLQHHNMYCNIDVARYEPSVLSVFVCILC
jgi:hypothetical protein